MKKVVLFPYHPDLRVLVDNKDFLDGYIITGFVSFNEDRHLIQPIIQACGLNDVAYEQLLENSDAVILLDNYREYKTEKYYQIIQDALSYQKEIFITPLAQTQLDLESYEGRYQLLEFLPDSIESIEEEFSNRQKKMLDDISVPVIGVIGEGKNCDKFQNQLLLKRVLEEEYNPVTVTTNALGALFGCYTIPSFLYEDLSFEEKIIRFNHYTRKISKLDSADVIVLGIPEGILPFTRYEFHHFAEYPLIISAAVSIDLAFLCTYFISGLNIEHRLRGIMELCHNKFNVPIGAIAISRTAFDIKLDEYEKINFLFLDKTYLQRYYPDLKHINLPMINMLDREDAATTIKMSLERLKENIRAIGS